jgi:hypothetical protein
MDFTDPPEVPAARDLARRSVAEELLPLAPALHRRGSR